ncbi:MAG: cupredoxin family copper-binding protein [Yoonia sp.]|jgi:plastocyanin|tara:strand:+ start:902 stop:1246 length:345 start_codon:yes stop_codon:yes gene_type:complete
MTHPTRRDALLLGAAFVALPLTAAMARADSHTTTHTVVIKSMKFTPADITIKAGDSVTWVNEDRPRHSATDLGGAFDTGLLATGDTATLTFGDAGQFGYRCTPHRNMRGTITIT